MGFFSKLFGTSSLAVEVEKHLKGRFNIRPSEALIRACCLAIAAVAQGQIETGEPLIVRHGKDVVTGTVTEIIHAWALTGIIERRRGLNLFPFSETARPKIAGPGSVTDRPLPTADPYSFASVQLSSPVVEAAVLSTAQLKALEPAVFGTTRLSDDLTHLKTTWEFFNFYGHLLDRSAFAALGTARRDKIIDAFVPYATRVLAVAMWPEASEQFQQNVARESQANFNQAQGEYGPCQVLFSDDPSDAEEGFPQALASRLYQNIARSLGGEPQGLYPVVVTILQERTVAMDLDTKVRAMDSSLT